MLVSVRVPIVDPRPFLGAPARASVRLPPTWSGQNEFIRFAGAIRVRAYEAVRPYFLENTYCRADRFLRFSPDVQRKLAEAVPGVRLQRVIRRIVQVSEVGDLFALELQLPFSVEVGGGPRPSSRDLVEALLRLEVEFQHGSCPLDAAGKHANLAFQRNTAASPDSSWPVFAPTLCVAVEAEHSDLDAPGSALKGSPDVVVRGEMVRRAPVWTIKVDSLSSRIGRSRARAIRSHLLNAWTQRESLRHIIWLARNDRIPVAERQSFDSLQDSLQRIESFIRRAPSKGGLAADDYDRLIAATALIHDDNELVALARRFEKMRLNLLRNVESMIKRENEKFLLEHAARQGVDVHMSDSSIHIYGPVTQSVVGHFNEVENSLNEARNSSAVSAELVGTLEELQQAAQVAAKELSDVGDSNGAEILSSDVADLVKEATRSEPRRGRVQNVLDDITSVAKKAAKHGPAVLSVVASVAKLLGL